jgi:uncharacterized RDD family membrane protein YckC
MSSAANVASVAGRRTERRERLLITPEGVPLHIELAEPGERLMAFIIDLTISTVAAIFIELASAFGPGANLTLPVTLFLAFVIRNCYFIFFELRWTGVTPGKKALGLRVIDRRGGPLRAGSVVARNLTRQAEFFFPLELLLVTHGWLWSMTDVLPVGLWLAAMFTLMVGSHDRLRAGDLIAGTVVISIPKRQMLEDLVQEQQAFQFTEKQMQVYGILELQVLEDVLRRPPSTETLKLMLDIRERIQKRIGWTPAANERDAAGFLRDFYSAQRAFLENRKHIGEERADKFHAK